MSQLVVSVRRVRTGAVSGMPVCLLVASALICSTASAARAQDPVRAHDLTGLVARNTVVLNWQAPVAPPEPVLSYLLDVGVSPGTTLVSFPLGNVLTFSAVAPDGVFFVRVQAVTASGPTGASNEIRLVTGQAGPPEAPLSLLSNVAAGNVSLQWTENPAGPVITGYVLEAGSAAGLADVATAPLPAPVRSLATPAPAGTYYVRVRASNAAGVGPPSNEAVVVSGGVICTPGAPTGLVANTVPGGVALSWNAPSSGGIPTGYVLLAGTASGATDLGTFPVGLTTSIAAPVPPGPYFVRVVATNGCGVSPPSNEVSFTVAPPQAASYIGTWDGVVFNHPGSYGHGPITSFTMTVTKEPSASNISGAGTWRDNLGCVSNNVVPFIFKGATVISIESLACNDGDFTMTVTSVSGATVQGTCRGTCTFRMTKR